MGMSMCMVAITSISKKRNDGSDSALYETLVALFLSDQNCSIPIGKPEREGLLDTVILAVPSTSTTREQQDHYRHKLLEAFAS